MQHKAQLDKANLTNVELTLYINELKGQIRDLTAKNRQSDNIQNWKSYEELT